MIINFNANLRLGKLYLYIKNDHTKQYFGSFVKYTKKEN
jgi:hypothetical protein